MGVSWDRHGDQGQATPERTEPGLPLMRESPPGTRLDSRLESRKDLGRGRREKREGGLVSEWARMKAGKGQEAGFESAEFGSRYREI